MDTVNEYQVKPPHHTAAILAAKAKTVNELGGIDKLYYEAGYTIRLAATQQQQVEYKHHYTAAVE